MTAEEKALLYKLRADGCTLKQCADVFHKSPEHIRQNLPPTGVKYKKPNESCVYPNISVWMKENRMSYNLLSEKLGFSVSSTWKALAGHSMPGKTFIDCILSLTGMTYEEAFKEV